MIDATTQPATVITGASSGIGMALAREAARDSKALVLIARSLEPMQVLADELASAGCAVHVLALDITKDEAGAAIEAFLANHGLHCAVLVNNAGVGFLGYAAVLDPQKQVTAVNLNVRALTDLTLRFLPAMIRRGCGGILNVGSVAGFLPGPGMAVYYASKAYVRSFSEALWEEARRAGVTVSCLAPGPVETAFLERAGVGRTQLFKTMNHMTAETCARIGWQGFRAGRRMIVPGLQTRIVTLIAPFIPRRLLLYAVRRLQKARAAR